MEISESRIRAERLNHQPAGFVDKPFTQFIPSPGGETKQIRGTVLLVAKKLPDGSWKAFRGMGM